MALPPRGPRIPPERCTHARTTAGSAANAVPVAAAVQVRVDYVQCLDCGRHVSLTRSTPLPDLPPEPTDDTTEGPSA